MDTEDKTLKGTDLAPPGFVFQCQACGKKSKSRYGWDKDGKNTKIDQDYDSSCFLHAYLVKE